MHINHLTEEEALAPIFRSFVILLAHTFTISWIPRYLR